jgi:hypothetical protein
MADAVGLKSIAEKKGIVFGSAIDYPADILLGT